MIDTRSSAGRRATLAVVASAIGLLGAACTGGTPPPPASGPPAAAGSILALTQDVGSPALVRFSLAAQRVAPVGPMPRTPSAAASAVGPDGSVTAAVVSASGVATAYAIPRGGRPRPVGPPLRTDPSADDVSVAATASRIVVSDCRSVRVLDVSAPARWTDLGAGCWATFSPDGSRVAYSPDGVRIVDVAAAGGAGRTLVDAADVPSIGGRGPARLFGTPAWGSGGIAFAVTQGDQAAIFLRAPDGRVHLIVQERLWKTVRPPVLTWQPGGDLLGIMDDLGTGGALRLFDPASARERVIGLDALGFDGLLWAPDGTSLATMTSAGALLVVGTDERWRARVDTTWNRMLAWTA
jgi:hypothetical protein